MFDLDEQALSGRILDCCAGSSSFVAGLTARGGDAVAADPAYSLPRSDLADTSGNGHTGTDRIISGHEERFTWRWYGSPQRRDVMRREAAARFADDIIHRPHTYVAAALPHLPFVDGSFDLVLCSHLLFTWSDKFDADWHHSALHEMLRVSRREVRVFPLVVQGTGEPVAFLDDLMTRISEDGYGVERRQVPYEFQRGANTMLVASRS